jgi:hypothetical protein
MKFILALLLCAPVLADGYSAIETKDGKANAALYQDAVNVNIRPECRAKLAPIVAAIRYSVASLGIVTKLGGALLLSRRTMIAGSRLVARVISLLSLASVIVPWVLITTRLGSISIGSRM